MKWLTLQIDESTDNETVTPTNDVFDEFRIFAFSLLLQILDGITLISDNVLK